MTKSIKHIVIVGGGSAGWLTAGILAAEFNHSCGSSIRVTLIESPSTSTIGVGEGTWPTMRTTLETIGISELEFLRECSASFKQGSRFVGWKTGAESDIYYHPFTLPQGFNEADMPAAWQAHAPQLPFESAVCLQGFLCDQSRSPKQTSTPEYAGVTSYGYHLDAGKFAQLLQRHCTAKLDVQHIKAHVGEVESASNGDIAALHTQEHGKIEGDLFIDCTGTACLLLGEHFQIPFLDQSRYSNNDRAIAIQVPYSQDQTSIASPTISTAQKAGWIWDIGLSSRRGTGHVYSSAYMSDHEAESCLRQYIAQSIGEKKAESLTARCLSIQAGHRAKFWHRNCVAVGMSAGFIEPLEASALALVELSAKMIRDEISESCTELPIIAERFNQRFTYRWTRIIDFLRLHYTLSQRRDSDYWCDATRPDTQPESLKELLSLWRYRAPSYADFAHAEEIFPAASYQYVLYGMGFITEFSSRQSSRLAQGLFHIQDIQQKKQKYAHALPSNRELIEYVLQYGMPKM